MTSTRCTELPTVRCMTQSGGVGRTAVKSGTNVAATRRAASALGRRIGVVSRPREAAPIVTFVYPPCEEAVTAVYLMGCPG